MALKMIVFGLTLVECWQEVVMAGKLDILTIKNTAIATLTDEPILLMVRSKSGQKTHLLDGVVLKPVRK